MMEPVVENGEKIDEDLYESWVNNIFQHIMQCESWANNIFWHILMQYNKMEPVVDNGEKLMGISMNLEQTTSGLPN